MFLSFDKENVDSFTFENDVNLDDNLDDQDYLNDFNIDD